MVNAQPEDYYCDYANKSNATFQGTTAKVARSDADVGAALSLLRP